MIPFRNGSLPANALLIAIGAAAGVGMTVLVAPVAGRGKSNGRESSQERQSVRHFDSIPKVDRKLPTLSDATGMENPLDRAVTFREAGAEAARKDPAAALAEAGNFTSEQDKLEFLRGIYSVWAASDPVSALEYAKSSLLAGLARSETIGIAVNKWAAKDPRAAWLWSEANLSGPLQEQAFTDVLIGWTRKCPADAAQWLSSTGYTSQPLITSVARTWAEQDLAKSDAWAAKLPDREARNSARTAIAAEAASQNPAAAAAHFADAISQPDGAAIAITIADIWGTTDPAAASAWLNQMPPGPVKEEAAATLAMVWAASDIQAAVAWSKSLGDEAIQRKVITHIGTTWGAIDPDSALDWLHTLPAAIAAEGVSGAFNSWAATDAAGLREVLEGTAVSPEMDQARLALADVLAATDIGSSLDLAAGISTAPGRDDAAARYFRQWRKVDDASAQEWLGQNWGSLEPSTRARLTREQQRVIVTR